MDAFLNMSGVMRDILITTQKELPKFSTINPEKHSMEELQQFLRQSKNPETIALVIQLMADHPDGSKALNEVKPLLDSKDLNIYAAALSYMMAHGSANDLPIYITNANDMLSRVLASEGKIAQMYRTKVAVSIQRAKETGRGQKAHLLFDRPTDSHDLFLQYSFLVNGYGAALRRGQETLPQLKKILLSSDNDQALVSVGQQLIEAGKFKEIKDMIVTSKEESKSDALILSLFLSMYMNPDAYKQAKSEKGIPVLCKELMTGGKTFSKKQKEFLEQMSK